MESSFRVKIMQARVQTRGRKQKDRPFVLLRRICGGIPDGDHVVQIDVMVHIVAGIRDIVLQDREKDQGSDAGCEASVIEHQAAVQGACCRTECGAEHAGNDACDRAVTSDDGTEAGGKGDAVDISLGGYGPCGIAADQVVEKGRE